MKNCEECRDGKEKDKLFQCFNFLSVEGYLRLDQLLLGCSRCSQ